MRNIVLLTLLDFYEGSRSLFLWSKAEVGMGVLFYFLKCNKPYVVFVIEKTITVNYSICTSKSSSSIWTWRWSWWLTTPGPHLRPKFETFEMDSFKYSLRLSCTDFTVPNLKPEATKLSFNSESMCWATGRVSDVSPLIHEVSSVLTNWRGVAGF